MFHSLRLPVQDFVHESLDRIGAEREETPDGVMEVLLPGEADLRRVTFEPEVAREEKGAELAAHGGRFLETLAEIGLRRGRLARAFASPAPIPPPNLGRAYPLRADRVSRTEWTDRVSTTWILAFGVRYAGEFWRESISFCAVDAASLRLVRRYEEPFSRLSFADAGPGPTADRPFEECYRVAREEILQKARIGFKAAERESDEDLSRELARLECYHGGLLREMNEDMEPLAAEDPRRAAILGRMQAVRADHDRSQSQARDRHRLSLEAEAIGALGIVYPRRVTSLRLSDERGRGAEVEAVWDPVLEQFDPLACPVCGRPTYSLELRGRSVSCGC